MSESDLWKHIKNNIGHRGHFSRVESHETSSGIPDVDYCIDGVEGHMELKFAVNAAPKIRGTQVQWFRKRGKAKGNPWMFSHLVLHNKDYYLLHRTSAMIDLAKQKDVSKWIGSAACIWVGFMDWHEFIKHLTMKGEK